MTGLIAIMKSHITTVQHGYSGPRGFVEGEWQERLTSITEAMREMSLQSDPLQMVQAYGKRVSGSGCRRTDGYR